MHRLILLLSSLIAITTVALACGDDEYRFDGDMGAVLTTLDILRDANIHHMNMTLAKEDAQNDPQWIDKVRNSRTAVAAVDWPEKLDGLAEDYLANSALFEAALSDDNVRMASITVVATHVAYHALYDESFEMLAQHFGTTYGGSHD